MKAWSSSRSHIPLLAGWLFADLLAMLFVIVLSTVQGRPVASASPSVSPSSSPSPSRTSTAHPFGLDPHFVNITIKNINYAVLQSQGINGSAGRSIISQVTSKIRAKPGGTRPVGFVVTLAEAPESPSGISIANSTANLVDRTLFTHQSQFARCQDQTGWSAGSSEGTVTLKIFFDNI